VFVVTLLFARFPSFLVNFCVFTLLLIIFEFYSDMNLRVTLWGQREKEFSINSVYDVNDITLIVMLFVGCLPKHFQGINTAHLKM
jgi:hypothetical protein